MGKRLVSVLTWIWLLISLLPITSSGENNIDRFEALFEGELKLLDLTYSLNSDNPYWPGPAYFPFKLRNIASIDSHKSYSNVICMPEHLGTHLDAPNHFVKGGTSLDQIPLAQFFGPAVVVNVTKKVLGNSDYQVSVAGLREWEKTNGSIPQGAIILAYTGWRDRWNNYTFYKNVDEKGTLHFPGYAPEVAEFLVEERNIYGLGIDTLSVDYGPSQDFRVHVVSHGAGKYHLENLANLDKLPPKGAYLIVAPIKIQGGSGGQARVFAILP